MTATNAPSNAPSAAQTGTLPEKLSAEQKAHEPSMDDILASIRRIIADDDAIPLSRRPPEVEAAAPVVVADAFFGLNQRLGRNATSEAEPVAPAPIAPASPPLPTLRLRDFMKPRPVVVEKPAPAEVAPVPTIEAATIEAATIETATTEAATTETAPMETAPVALAAPVAAASEPQAPALAAEPAAPRPAASEEPNAPAPVVKLVLPVADEPAPPDVAFRAPVGRPVISKPSIPDPSVSQTASASPAVEQPAPAPEPQDLALLSPASGARVNASFEALTENLLLRDPQMLERLSREMLRPMLKAWLDDNLPIVVERLVRAEIERVARGRG